ncbi:MAG: hypothetical protein JW929_14590 [Anaerolineales bacterium]|nr:hypothetical protein [Anaerolineales bacterium]
MNAEALLDITDISLLMIEERPKKSVVVAVPHHAPAGKEILPCLEHQEADENAGFLGRYLAERLNCCSVIACNYPVDSNKFFRSDYSMQIAAWNPKVLVEIHGHSGRKAKAAVEISSGGGGSAVHAKLLAEKLAEAFQEHEALRAFTVCGDYEAIFYKASGTVTITDGRWVGYHIELPPNLRKMIEGMDTKPPKAGYAFCDALARALQEIHKL